MIAVILIWSFINVVWVLGLTIVTQEGMALYKIREWAENKKSSIYEPVILCVWCMPSLHSLVAYAFAIALGLIAEPHWRHLVAWPLVIMLTSLLTGSIWSLCTIWMNRASITELEHEQLRLSLQEEDIKS